MQSKSKELKQGVRHSHHGLAIYIKKKYRKAKEEELWKLKYNFTMQNITFKKNPLEETQNPSRSYNSLTNLKFPTQAQISSFKNPHLIIIDLLLLRGQNPLSYYYTL
jgi:hypothetical protein